MLDNLRGHFMTITRHKIMVMEMCFKIGLYKQGLLHDLSKYSPIEFWPGVKYYQGHRSPINAEKEEKIVSPAWLHHKGRNRHHFEYWIDYSVQTSGGPDQGNESNGRMIGMKMFKRYVAEMVVDRICASKNYQKENYKDSHPLAYYMRGLPIMKLDPETEYLTRYLLTMLSLKGEDYTLSYMKHRLLKHPDRDYHVVDGRLYLD